MDSDDNSIGTITGSDLGQRYRHAGDLTGEALNQTLRRDHHYGSMGTHIRQVVRSAERPTNFRPSRVAG
ncbi:GM26924, isoform B [Drosophila sechellia]|uniref:GM26924, isoform B n=1 Tax=Drosophila sechellia TaxID=7238 RepID=B4IAM8_DROSE|nr:GM26924, isoform B [Drosophila sechellia]